MMHRLFALLLWLTAPVCVAVAAEIGGVVRGHDGDAVAHATVVLCDQATGIPVSSSTFQPFTAGEPDLKSIAVATTDTNGAFRLQNVAAGRYRLVAQSWPGRPAVVDLIAKNGTAGVRHCGT